MRYWLRLLGSFLLGSFLLSCSSRLGYGIVLWSDLGSQSMSDLQNGQMIRISGASKVRSSYLFSYNSSEHSIDTDRVAFFRHRANAKKYLDQFLQYRDWYAMNMNTRGLVMRAAPNLKSEQVYRLRSKQTVKVLREASENLTLGNIEGRWYEVLTEDGIRGFAFDYYLRIEDRSAEEQVIKLAVSEQNQDQWKVSLESLDGVWYLQRYSQLLHSGKNIDLRLLMLPRGQFYLDQDNKQIELYLGNSAQTLTRLPYEPKSVAIEGQRELSFNDGNIRTMFSKLDVLSLYFKQQNREESIIELHKIDEDELELYRKQALIERKSNLLSIFQHGSRLSAAWIYGSIRFEPNGQFSWSNTSALVDAELLHGNPSRGIVYFPYQMGPALKDKYDQLLAFAFEDQQELVFLMKIMADKRVLLRYVPPFMIDESGFLNSDSFNQKLEIQMLLEGTPLLPVNLF